MPLNRLACDINTLSFLRNIGSFHNDSRIIWLGEVFLDEMIPLKTIQLIIYISQWVLKESFNLFSKIFTFDFPLQLVVNGTLCVVSFDKIIT